jgi:cytoskeletal protein CcmA (bactofilin family)
VADLNSKDESTELPAPEVLQAHGDTKKQAETQVPAGDVSRSAKKQNEKNHPKRSTYRPSHKATFIGLAVIGAVLLVNVVIIVIVVRFQSVAEDTLNRTDVTVSAETLEKLGVSSAPIGDLGAELTIGPDAQFNGKVVISGDTTIAGSLTLNSSFSAAEGSFAKLQGGETSLTSLNVNQDATTSNLNVRDELVVDGTTRLQGSVTVSQLLTVNNNLNVAGSLAVGGTLTVRELRVTALTTDTTLTIGGHVITKGSAPGVSVGSAAGGSGTVSISGSDTAGTVAVNVGTGGGNGLLVSVSFVTNYGKTPRVLITPIGRNAGDIYVNRNASGFSIYSADPMPPGGYAFDYWVVE